MFLASGYELPRGDGKDESKDEGKDKDRNLAGTRTLPYRYLRGTEPLPANCHTSSQSIPF